MNYCNQCSGKLTLLTPNGDHRQRYVCLDCGNIHYTNPKVVTGCLVEHNKKILLCKRNIEPRKGLWTLPAGFMEDHETSAEGAARETYEETLADVSIDELFAFYDIPHISQIYMIYRAHLKTEHYGPTAESSEVVLMTESEIPWSEIAFPVIEKTLKHFYASKKTGKLETHFGIIDRRNEVK